MQGELNIGLFGHVDHGKTTLVKQLTGKWTDTHSEEMKRGISIRIGYADTKFYECEKCQLFTSSEKCEKCKGPAKFRRKVSFVDSPGHETLMANTISASSIIDGALFLVAANEKFPQEQTKEHLEILKLVNVKNLIVIQTKVDIISKEEAKLHYKQIIEYMKDKLGFTPTVIPISATYGLNIDKVIKAIELEIPTPEKKKDDFFIAYVLRSFDINKPGTLIENLKGGVIGVTILSGSLKVGENICIFPGVFVDKGNLVLKSLVTELKSEASNLESAVSGGLIALGTNLDPSITKSDSLSGNILIKEKDTQKVTVSKNLVLKYNLLKRSDFDNPPLRSGEALLININTTTTSGVITGLSKGKAAVILKRAVALIGNEKIAISRRIGDRWRLSAVASNAT